MMSGYRNSGLTQQEFGDREILVMAKRVIEERWPDWSVTRKTREFDCVSALGDLADLIGAENEKGGV